MKKIKVFSIVLALGLGATATFAFKAHKMATQVIAPSDGSQITYHSAGGYYIVLNPEDITDQTPTCNNTQATTYYCDLQLNTDVDVSGDYVYVPKADVLAAPFGNYNQ